LSVRIEDREGRLLREFLSGMETRSNWAALEEFSPHLIRAALAAEDKRFFSHPGVDPLALVRAMIENIRAGKVVGGASTITMQLCRLLDPGPRTIKRKAVEAARALRLERSYTKERILEEYLNRAPFGNLAIGLPAAAALYFDKSPAVLSPAEAAFLMALPQAPGFYNPYRDPGPALKRRNVIIDRMAKLGFLEVDQAARAKKEPLDLKRSAGRFLAPHFTRYVRGLLPDPTPPRVRTTLNLELQESLERLTRQAVAREAVDGITQASVLVMDVRTREVLAWVGSSDFFDPKDGQNDGVLALRQPGSAVKPFTYASAFDRWLTPAELIDDKPVEYGLRLGVYTPANYDRRFRGAVSARLALASSLNVPAVRVLERTGLETVYREMKAAGLSSLVREPDYYGLGLTLGSGEVSLLELANAYATLAAGGVYKSPVFFRDRQGKEDEGQRVYSTQAAYLVTNILSDDGARATSFGRESLLDLPFPAAAKTGTSKNFRDNWTVGYSDKFVVAVWAGNFDAQPMGRVSGISGAGPLWREAMRLTSEKYPPAPFARPTGLEELEVCPDTGLRAGPACPNRKTEIFIAGRLPRSFCTKHAGAELEAQDERAGRERTGLAILSPRPGERYLYDPGIEDGFQNIRLEARGRADFDWLVWYVNGDEAGRVRGKADRADLLWPLRRGELEIRLVGLRDGREAESDRVTITVH
jgi:penicillin-binding protein 1C